MERRGGSEDDDEGGAGYSGGAFAADEQSEKHDGLLRDGEMDAGGLGDEDQGEGLVKAGAIGSETVTGGGHEGDGISRDAQVLHCSPGARARGFGSGTRARAMAKRMLKTTTCKTWFSATDLAMFSGKMSMMSCVAVCGVALSDSAVAEGGRRTPSPARLMLMAAKPMSRAMVETISK